MKNLTNEEKLAKYFAGELSENNIEEMEKDFLRNNMEEEIKDYSKIWEKSKTLGQYDEIDVDGDWRAVHSKMGFNRRAKKMPFAKYMIRIAAIFIFAIGLTYMFKTLLSTLPVENNTDYLYLTATSDIKQVYLPDSTLISLNRNSQLIYNSAYGMNNRQVILEGEAFFEVTRNEELPFQVFTNNSTVEVLGTSFTIKSTDKLLFVGVVTGHVAVYETEKKNNRLDLVKNEQTYFDLQNNTFEPKTELNYNSFTWKTGVLELKGESMVKVFEVISEYFNLTLNLQIENPFTETLESHSIKINNIEEVLTIIQKTAQQNFTFELLGDELIIKD